MTTSKPGKIFIEEEKWQYAKIIIKDGYPIPKVAAIADAWMSVVGRVGNINIYKSTLRYYISTIAFALSIRHQEIQRLQKTLERQKRDNEILKK